MIYRLGRINCVHFGLARVASPPRGMTRELAFASRPRKIPGAICQEDATCKFHDSLLFLTREASDSDSP